MYTSWIGIEYITKFNVLYSSIGVPLNRIGQSGETIKLVYQPHQISCIHLENFDYLERLRHNILKDQNCSGQYFLRMHLLSSLLQKRSVKATRIDKNWYTPRYTNCKTSLFRLFCIILYFVGIWTQNLPLNILLQKG